MKEKSGVFKHKISCHRSFAIEIGLSMLFG